jgi:hypothetical protein
MLRFEALLCRVLFRRSRFPYRCAIGPSPRHDFLQSVIRPFQGGKPEISGGPYRSELPKRQLLYTRNIPKRTPDGFSVLQPFSAVKNLYPRENILRSLVYACTETGPRGACPYGTPAVGWVTNSLDSNEGSTYVLGLPSLTFPLIPLVLSQSILLMSKLIVPFTSLIAIVSLNCSDSGDICLLDIMLADGTHASVVHHTISNVDDDIGAGRENSDLSVHIHDTSTYPRSTSTLITTIRIHENFPHAARRSASRCPTAR